MFVLLGLMLCCGILLSLLLACLLKRSPVLCESNNRLDGKVALITGGSSGIGLAVAVDLARRGAKIHIAGRNNVKGCEAVQYIQMQSQNPYVFYSYLDLTDFNSVKCYADYILSEETALDILINNAGIGATYEEDTKDGGDTIFTANYLGHFLLTFLLLDLLKKSSSGRIINTASVSHMFVHSLALTASCEKQGDHMYPQLRGYDVSKLALVMHAKELSRKLAGTMVTANAVAPALSMTNFWYTTGIWWPSLVAMLARWILRPIFQSPIQAAQTTIHCAVSDDLAGISGRYYEGCKRKRESSLAHNQELSSKLWDISLLLTGCHGDGRMVDIRPEFRYLDEEEMWQKKIQRQKAYSKGKEIAYLAPEMIHPMTRA